VPCSGENSIYSSYEKFFRKFQKKNENRKIPKKMKNPKIEKFQKNENRESKFCVCLKKSQNIFNCLKTPPKCHILRPFIHFFEEVLGVYEKEYRIFILYNI
tara:strand:+ start:45 stop:347 length:303 start_codon:yes stop_codon:yes gene_type:complete